MKPEEMLQEWQSDAQALRRRPLTAEELAAMNEEILKGKLHPGLQSRALKRAIRKAIDCARPGAKSRSGT